MQIHFRQKPGASLAFPGSCELLRGSHPFCRRRLRFAYGGYVAEAPADRLAASRKIPATTSTVWNR
ncbi:MAG: hypothetical protein U0802_11460 [Candidatus Binatia bacterium]